VDLIRGVVILPAREAEAIKLAAVETDEIGPQPLRVDESDQGSLAHRVMIPQLRRANENAEKVADIRRSIHLNAQPRPDHAAAAAAIDKVGCGDLKPLVVRAVVHGRDNMAARVADRLQTTTVAEFDLVEAPGELRQDGIEKKLIAALRAFRALLDRLTAAMGGAFDASDLVTAERRAIEDRVREVIGRAGRAHRIRYAPPAHELHSARIEGSGARMARQTVPLLTHETRSAAQPQIRGERNPDRATADKEDRSFQSLAGHLLLSDSAAAQTLPHRVLDEAVGPGLALDELRRGRRIVAHGLAEEVLDILPVARIVLAGAGRVGRILSCFLCLLEMELLERALFDYFH